MTQKTVPASYRHSYWKEIQGDSVEPETRLGQCFLGRRRLCPKFTPRREIINGAATSERFTADDSTKNWNFDENSSSLSRQRSSSYAVRSTRRSHRSLFVGMFRGSQSSGGPDSTVARSHTGSKEDLGVARDSKTTRSSPRFGLVGPFPG